eukprot:gnl/Hemi2/28431_TR9405_c0_g1_i1.p1 gnl/Hemi2/28431_TR9405_c0_g1~~gnl/Hemi2/28431_TR9405_c0_g1_i1.p1  ORF type:complete len:580 (+),score=84.71 gnl/Hemi2/28431_TR9405_c0_g1_i1:82-1821(+)
MSSTHSSGSKCVQINPPCATSSLLSRESLDGLKLLPPPLLAGIAKCAPPECSGVEALDLSQHGLVDSDLPALALVLLMFKNVRALDLSRNHLSDGVTLAGLLGGCTNLEVLNLSHNPLGGNAAGVEALLRGLATTSFPRLHRLDLSNTNLDHQSVISLASSLVSNTTVTQITLTNCVTSEVQMNAFVQTFANNSVIQQASLLPDRGHPSYPTLLSGAAWQKLQQMMSCRERGEGLAVVQPHTPPTAPLLPRTPETPPPIPLSSPPPLPPNSTTVCPPAATLSVRQRDIVEQMRGFFPSHSRSELIEAVVEAQCSPDLAFEILLASNCRSSASATNNGPREPKTNSTGVVAAADCKNGCKALAAAAAEEFECTICLCSCSSRDKFTLTECAHSFCQNCFHAYLRTKICDSQVRGLACPTEKCTHKITHAEVQRSVDAALFAKYEEFLLAAALRDDPNCRWCPRPGCSNAIIGDPSRPLMVCTNQSCNFAFCFRCREEWHSDFTCEQYQQWKLENSEAESRYQAWAERNTRPCPRCQVKIQKNGGCNHMTCTQCRHEFCWLCDQDYLPGHYATGSACTQYS